MSGKLTNDGVQWVADLANNALIGATLSTSYASLEIGTGVKGNLVAAASIALNANAAKGATAIVLKDSGAGTLTGNLIAGDLLTFTNDDTPYEVAANATAAGNLISVTLTNPLVMAHATGDVCVTSIGASSTDAGVRTPLASGGRVAITTGWPKIVTVSSGVYTGKLAVEAKASFPAGTFTVGTQITEAAIRQNSSGGKCAARVIFDTPQNPSASQSLDVTLQIPLLAKVGG